MQHCGLIARRSRLESSVWIELLCLSSNCFLNKLGTMSRFNTPVWGIKSPVPKYLPNTGNLQRPQSFEPRWKNKRDTISSNLPPHHWEVVQDAVTFEIKYLTERDLLCAGRHPRLDSSHPARHTSSLRRWTLWETSPWSKNTHTDTHECRMSQAILAQTRCLCGCVAIWGWWWCCCCDLMAKDEAGDSSDEFGHEDQTQEDGVLRRKRQHRVRFR